MVQLKFFTEDDAEQLENVLIPVWCNWNLCYLRIDTTVLSVLIPVWCNWNYNTDAEYKYLGPVLIPVWCNWNTSIDPKSPPFPEGFNSCMVQLKLRISNADTIIQFCFNSCMVQLKWYTMI